MYNVSNLTKRPVYQKGTRSKDKPTPAQRRYWLKVLALGCVVDQNCSGRTTIHHCGTGAGGRKDHMKVIPLCEQHHLGAEGIDGKRMSKRAWQDKYGTEEKLIKQIEQMLDMATKG